MTNHKNTNKYIFVDTFAINQLTKEDFNILFEWVNKNRLVFLLTSFEIVELFNPNHVPGDRISRFIDFLIEYDFVIVDQIKIMELEELAYPLINQNLPINLEKEKLFKNLSISKQQLLLEKLFSSDLEYVGIKIKDWVSDYHYLKDNWSDDVKKLLADIERIKIKTKSEIIEYLNLRLCRKIVSIKNKMANSIPFS